MRTIKIDILDERAVDFLKHLKAQNLINIVRIDDDQNAATDVDSVFSRQSVEEIKMLLSNFREASN